MNPLTQVKNTQKATQFEIHLGLGETGSWHARFRHSAYIFAGGLDFDLTEGDLLAVFAQYGELVDVNLVRDKATGKSRGFAFLAYEDQRSTVLAVDNLSGAKVAGRVIRVEHVDNYKKRKAEAEGEEYKEEEEPPAGARAAAAAPGARDGRPEGATGVRWAHDKFAEGRRDTRAGPAPGAPLPSSDPWAGPGSLFSMLQEAPPAKRPAASAADAGADDAHVGHKHKRHKKEKKEKKEQKHKRDRCDSSPSPSPRPTATAATPAAGAVGKTVGPPRPGSVGVGTRVGPARPPMPLERGAPSVGKGDDSRDGRGAREEVGRHNREDRDDRGARGEEGRRDREGSGGRDERGGREDRGSRDHRHDRRGSRDHAQQRDERRDGRGDRDDRDGRDDRHGRGHDRHGERDSGRRGSRSSERSRGRR